MQVIVVPAGSSSALAHYKNTIESPVSIDTIRTFADDEIANELETSGLSAVAVWGFTAGGDDRNVVRWQKVEPGAVALFRGEGKVKSYGTVLFKSPTPRFSDRALGRDQGGQTWEYIIFLDRVVPLEDVSTSC